MKIQLINGEDADGREMTKKIPFSIRIRRWKFSSVDSFLQVMPIGLPARSDFDRQRFESFQTY